MLCKKKGLFLWIVMCLFLISSGPQQNPEIVYLTYTQDPTSSITVQWHSSTSQTDSTVFYRKQGEEVWEEVKGSHTRPNHSDWVIHRVDLGGLVPNTYYQFRIGECAKIHLFRTLPCEINEKSLKVAIGGDAYRFLSAFRKTNRQIAKNDPDFIIVGGDIAYTEANKAPFKGREWEMKRWMTFFSEWKSAMIGKDGRIIPIVPVVGNHDVPKKMADPRTTPVTFYQIFAFPEANLSYRTLDIGESISFILLDSDHSYPIAGEQTEWLKKTLEERKDVRYKFAAYHISAFPSVYSYNAKIARRIRENWCPLFEEYGVPVAFEHHNHAFKRTYPIKQEQVNAKGVIYVGDGCWGVKPRGTVSKAWYLEKKAKKNTFTMITFLPTGCDIVSYTNSGEVIDRMPRISAEPVEAAL